MVEPTCEPLMAEETVELIDVPKKGAYRRMISDRNFRRLWIAQFVSGIGDWLVIGFLMPLVTKLSGGSSFAVAGILIAKILPALVLSSLTGVLVDRFDRRKVMIAADLVRAVLSLVLVVTNSLWVIYLAVMLMETASLFFWPARNSLLPYLVHDDDITEANGLAYTTQQASMLIGLTAAAGILAGFEAIVRALIAADLPLLRQVFTFAAPALLGPRAGVILDVFTFLFSAATIWSMHVKAVPARREGTGFDVRLLGHDVVESVRFLIAHRELRGLLVTVGLAILGGGAIIPVGATYVEKNLTGSLPFANRFQQLQQLTASPTTFMLVFMAFGMVAGALLVPRIERKVPLRLLFGGSVAAFGISLMGFASVNTYWIAGIFGAAAGGCIATLTVAGNSYVVRTTADELRGRVFTAMESVIKVSLLVSMVVMAPLADLAGRVVQWVIAANRLAPTLTLTGSRVTLQFSAVLVMAAAIYGFQALRWRECEPEIETAEEAAPDA